MNKDKLISLTKYLQSLKDKLSSATPKKHLAHPDTHKNFLKNEIRLVEAKLDRAKLEGVR